MGVTINNESTSTQNPLKNRQQPKPPGGLNRFYWYQIIGLVSAVAEVYSVQIRGVGRFLAKLNPWTNTSANRLVRSHCSRTHPSVKLYIPIYMQFYSCCIATKKRFELLQRNLISADIPTLSCCLKYARTCILYT